MPDKLMPISKTARLPHLPPPVLTAYLDVNPANPRNQSTPRGYLKWLKSAGQALGREVPSEAKKPFRAQLRRITRHLAAVRPRSRALVLFSGPEVWEEIPLQVEVTDELHWGKPSLQQMAWLIDEHRPRGAVVLDGNGARFLRFYLGAVTEDPPYRFSVDVSSWRKPYLVGPSTSRVSKQSGIERDRVAARVAQQRKHFLAEASRRITEWAKDADLSPVILIGSGNEVEAVSSSVPEEFRRNLVALPKALPQISSTAISKRVRPMLKHWEREYEKKVVNEIVASQGSGEAVIGLDETLDQLQRGQVRELVIARGLKGFVERCTKCAWVDRSAVSACPVCGSRRERRSLRTLLPELAGEHSVPMEVVAGAAAKLLSSRGGIAGWLRTARRRPQNKAHTPLIFSAG
jgi:hypothetical protein